MNFEKYCPYPCYPAQKIIMQEIFDALTTEKLYLLEGACGTGKTLSALIPAISVAKDLKKLVVIATNVNQQKEQFITEAKSIRSKANINIIVMSSKIKLCYHNNIPGISDITDYTACEKMRNAGECEPYNRVKGKQDNKEETAQLEIKFEKWCFSSVRTPADIMAWGSENKVCVYSLVLKALSCADVVICDLNILLKPEFRFIFEYFTCKSMQDMIIIFDEAHNIEKVAKGVYSHGISNQTLHGGLTEIDTIIEEIRKGIDFGLDMRQLEKSREFIKNVFLNPLMELKISETDIQNAKRSYADSEISIADPDKPYCDRSDEFTDMILRKVENMGGEQYVRTNLDILDDIGQKYKDKFKKSDPEHNSKSKNTTIAKFFIEYLDIHKQNGYYPYLSIKKSSLGTITRRINIHLSLPNIISAPIMNTIFAGVLMSATLEPFSILKEVLGISRECAEHTVGLKFPLENRRTYIVTRDVRNDYLAGVHQKHAPDRLVSKNDDNPASLLFIQNSIEAVIDGSNNNVLIFFKTKNQAAQFHSRLQSKYGDRILLNVESDSVGEIKDVFYQKGYEGKRAVLCTYLGGSLTEGVDFKDDRARVVIVVGIGYTSHRSLLVKADETAYNVKFGKEIGWDYVVQIPTIHKIRQAMGRVIRSDKDYGIRILLDARYTKNTKESVFKLFSPEERREFVEIKTQYVKDIVCKDFKLFTK